MSIFKQLPDGTPVGLGQDYEVELHKFNEQIRQKEKLADVDERNARFELEQKSIERKIEYEARTKFFITLATLSAASITLLIQHFFLAFSEYGQSGQWFLRVSLVLFGMSLILSISHNFLNTRNIFGRNENAREAIIAIGSFAAIAYVLSIGILLVAVLINT